MSKQTKQKYLNAMMQIADGNVFKGKPYTYDNRLDSGFVRAMNQVGLVKKVGPGKYQWIQQRLPTPQDVRLIQKNLKAHRLSVAHNQQAQLTIAPIRKAPVPTPIPIAKEPEYDNSNSKILLILAAGAIVGFLVATLIWK